MTSQKDKESVISPLPLVVEEQYGQKTNSAQPEETKFGQERRQPDTKQNKRITIKFICGL